MIAEYYIIINELAGSGHGKQVWETIKPILEQRQIHFEYRISEYAGHTIRLAAEYVKTIQRRPNITPVILVVGGDGTLNEALNGIMQVPQQDPIPIAYIPGGSGNDFARGLGMATDPEIALAQVLNNMRPRTLNVGYYHETLKNEHRYFVNNVGLGFDAQIVDDTNRSKQKGRLGRWSYLSNMLTATPNRRASRSPCTSIGSVTIIDTLFSAPCPISPISVVASKFFPRRIYTTTN
ncbi:diacylglycerol/lipid kinase family protein [Lactiplantibacillus pentosus]|uniref:diacylglycerol/lipid kinase family protein n=1 Tax=Lactiplantibacillus pentosus TaxID=1589 RepID=UPI0021A67037|nr:diacylglycerol kinase family protein [Lactiplantibacillus pentosus]